MNLSQEDDYGRELTNTLNSLNELGFTISVRGDGLARFLFVETANRSVEISRSGEKIFIEFFENEDAIQEDYLNDFQIAIQRVVSWLKN